MLEHRSMSAMRIDEGALPDSKRSAQDRPDFVQLYRKMAIIRGLEEALLHGFRQRELSGTTHTSMGQEGVAVAAMAGLGADDVVFSNHRCHGHFLAYGGEVDALLLEIVGDPGGVSGGMGGSQHLQFREFLSNGVQGGIAPLAAGAALALKRRQSDAIALCFLGDGTMGEGVVYETFNIASLWQLPVLFVIENNGIAQTTPISTHLAGSIRARPEAFDIPTAEVDSSDLAILLPAFEQAFAHVRSGSPYCLVVNTVRLGPHSKGDDTRAAAEIERIRKRDPLVVNRSHLSAEQADRVTTEANELVETAVQHVRRQVEITRPNDRIGPQTDDSLVPAAPSAESGLIGDIDAQYVVEHLRDAIAESMASDPRMILLGEDIHDPYGGAFKVTKGLSEKFRERILTTPISEAAVVGIANGLALRGLKPVVEIMFGDFITLAADQIINHAAKFRRMSNDKVSCPVVIRAPMGGYRGYGPTHSQSLEKLFLGVPDLVVVALNSLNDQRLIWRRMLALDSPVLFIENKSVYGHQTLHERHGFVEGFLPRSSKSYFPTVTLRVGRAGGTADLALVSYGGMVEMAMKAAREVFMADEIATDVIVVSQLAPLPIDDLRASLRACGRIAILEEGTRRCGWGAEVIASLNEVQETAGRKFLRHASADTIIPASPSAELQVLPSLPRLLTEIRGFIR
jgi:2-oxoisovalerate dehydrogenase E1 component